MPRLANRPPRTARSAPAPAPLLPPRPLPDFRGPLLPSHLLALAQEGHIPDGLVAVDTETSGLYVDAGARISTVSVGWVDLDHSWLPHDVDPMNGFQYEDTSSIHTWGYERLAPLHDAYLYGAPLPDEHEHIPVFSAAWSFDQGVEGTGKPEDRGTFGLWADTENLPREEFEALLAWLTIVGSKCGLSFHNAKFDMHQFRVGCRRWPDLNIDLLPYFRWDTQNGVDMLWGFRNGGTSLKPNSARLWGDQETAEQATLKKYLHKRKLPSGRWDLAPWDIIGVYADDDARKTARMQFLQEFVINHNTSKWLADGAMMRALLRRNEVTSMLYRVERRGLPFHVGNAWAADADIQERILEYERRLPFSPATLPMAKHYWFGKGKHKGVEGLGLPPYETTDTGQPALNQTIVDKMIKANRPGAEVWKDLTQLAGASSRWYAGWASRAGDDGRLRTSIRQNGTVSGRFSVENIQLQAIPHDYQLSDNAALVGIPTPRRLIEQGVPEHLELWELDLAQAELRVAALFANCTPMLKLIHEGADLHSDTATQLFGIKEGHPDWDMYRTVSKRGNFSLIFGVGWETFQGSIEDHAGILMPEREVRTLIRDWNTLYPQYQRAIRETMWTIEERQRTPEYGRGYGWVTLANGERRWFKPGEDTHKGFNQRVQGSLAQYAQDMWLAADRYLMEQIPPSVGGGMVLMVHDSMVLLLPRGDEGERLVEQVKKIAADLWQEWFPGLPGGLDAKRWAKKS